MEGGAPRMERLVFEGPDTSWRDEWADFVAAILDGATYLGGPDDGIVAMETLASLYRSAESGLPAAYEAAGG
jgi:predicted dehydrogenase